MRTHSILLGAFGACLLATPAIAQRSNVLGFGASMGANLPNGDYGDAAKVGVVANGFLDLRFADHFGLRGSLLWSRSDIDNPIIRSRGSVTLPSVFGPVSGNVNVLGASADAVMPLSTSAFRPYLIGGVGVYRRRVAQDISGTITEFESLRESDTKVGVNGGLGLELQVLGTSLFTEARYYSINTPSSRTNFIPVTIGVRF
jgi:hypothetical protein